MSNMGSLSDLETRLRENERPVILDIWAPWCGPCKAMEPALTQVGEEYQGRVDVWKLNADEKHNLARELGVRAVPTLIVFSEGKEVERRSGAQSSAALKNLFEAALAGEMPASAGVAINDRLLRLFASLAVFVLGVAAGPSLLLVALSGIILFSAVHDRCPLWQAVSPRLAKVVRRLT